jgi:hypothetical protein
MKSVETRGTNKMGLTEMGFEGLVHGHGIVAAR